MMFTVGTVTAADFRLRSSMIEIPQGDTFLTTVGNIMTNDFSKMAGGPTVLGTRAPAR